eukprot:CAMPEP_0203962246 /NCGR_PEP_ID=MMETSP0359-20131031/92493_1 /ASSEMBLY_ACC=CAM_ASM_000338 /TAXON_ID=268821 /ORGANISM="Scrippsiella Hangoei, Strain SHTV-5" /LENGTH=31 /DNA_ID= /DNA_START= /DNA_END= /DNA_ORIENTATION=
MSTGGSRRHAGLPPQVETSRVITATQGTGPE